MQELPFRFRGETWMLGREARVMGILNVTPDSFSDGGRFAAVGTAVEHGLAMAEAGAAILDVGGESTRPGAAPVPADEECRRVLPVIRELSRQTRVPISIDTWKAEVAEAALDAGAAIVNDISGLQRDGRLPEVLRRTGAGCVLMHMRGTPQTMQQLAQYDDLVGEIAASFREALGRVAAAGLEPATVLLDPGIGFSKTAAQNLVLLAHLARFRVLGRPLLVGVSRKSFIAALLDGAPAAERAWGTAAAVACAVLNGADVIRVHDVREMRQVATVAAAIRAAG